MLFNSYVFIFIFLPITYFGFLYFLKKESNSHIIWLGVCSLFFYSWFDPRFLLVLLPSIVFNYQLGKKIRHSKDHSKIFLIFGVCINLCFLALFKYAQFISEILYFLLSSSKQSPDLGITLPIGISFFTFTQIAYLVDTYHKKSDEQKPENYLLFVTYFPHLIAGPILHHKEMMPQFSSKTALKDCNQRYQLLATGLSLFFMGLFKKTVIADQISAPVEKVFDAASFSIISSADAWAGIISYSLQIYFDFSAYSEMAIGLSIIFGIKLPINFYSPYKSTNIIEFWRRWHITLSRFLRDYLYIPLGGNKKGGARKYTNIILTMLLGGLWHGASWTFIIWGLLHGIFLLINHFWRSFFNNRLPNIYEKIKFNWAYQFISLSITFIAVTTAWVFFRANDIESALNLIKSMYPFLQNFFQSQSNEAILNVRIVKSSHFFWLFITLLIVFFSPSIIEIFNRSSVYLESSLIKSSRFFWSTTYLWLTFVILIATASVISISSLSEFIYFNF